VKRRKRARVVHFTDNSRIGRSFDHDEIVRADASQGYGIGWIGVVRPMPFIAGAMNEPTFAQEIQNFGNIVSAKTLVASEWQLKGGALKMIDQDVNVVRIDQSHFRWLAEKIFRMGDDELMQRRAGRDQYRHGHSAASACAPHALPGGGNSAGIAGKYRDVKASDID